MVAALLAAGASLLLLLWPVYSTASDSYSSGPDGSGSSAASVGRATLLDVNGPGALWGLLIPPALAVVPLLVPGAQRLRAATSVSAAALVVLVVLSGFSIGVFYIPSAVAMVVAAGQQAGQRVNVSADG